MKLTILLLAITAELGAGPIDALAPRIEHAHITGAKSELARHREELKRVLSQREFGEPGLTRYTLAYVDWRLYLAGMPKPDKALLEEARSLVEELIKAEPSNAEAHALLATLLGLQIAQSPWKGMLLGPKSSNAVAAATAAARDNPRVALQAGVGAFHTPRAFGGGAEKAEKELRRAEALFASESPSAPWPSWGRYDVLAWLGQVLAAKGDKQGARAYYQRALAAQPDYAWVKYVLLPKLDSPSRK